MLFNSPIHAIPTTDGPNRWLAGWRAAIQQRWYITQVYNASTRRDADIEIISFTNTHTHSTGTQGAQSQMICVDNGVGNGRSRGQLRTLSR